MDINFNPHSSADSHKRTCWATYSMEKYVSVFCFDNCVAVIHAMFHDGSFIFIYWGVEKKKWILFRKILRFYCQLHKGISYWEREKSEVKIGATENMTCRASASLKTVENCIILKIQLRHACWRLLAKLSFHHQFMLLFSEHFIASVSKQARWWCGSWIFIVFYRLHKYIAIKMLLEGRTSRSCTVVCAQAIIDAIVRSCVEFALLITIGDCDAILNPFQDFCVHDNDLGGVVDARPKSGNNVTCISVCLTFSLSVSTLYMAND